jgi:glucokinase
MFLGIEIGGTKLQFGVGAGDGAPFTAFVRKKVDPKKGAEGIRQQIAKTAPELIREHGVEAVGIGFGGPVDSLAGRIVKSHQVGGWDDFPLVEWCQRTLGVRTLLANDSDSAGLAEARFGAGKGHRIVLYNNVGSGIGGAFVIDGRLYTGSTGIATEIGHLRPGIQSERPDQTVESLASGWAIASAAQALVSDPVIHRLEQITSRGRPRSAESVRQRLIEREELLERCAGDLLERCQGHVDQLTTVMVAEAAVAGNELARDIFQQACQALGWALGQVVTLVAPSVIVLGGGVSLVADHLFLEPLRKEVERYVFPPLQGSFQIVRAALGEEVVVHGVLALVKG